MSTSLNDFMSRNEHLTGDARMDNVHEEFYALLQAFVIDAVPLFDAVKDVHEGYVASGNAKDLAATAALARIASQSTKP